MGVTDAGQDFDSVVRLDDPGLGRQSLSGHHPTNRGVCGVLDDLAAITDVGIPSTGPSRSGVLRPRARGRAAPEC